MGCTSAGGSNRSTALLTIEKIGEAPARPLPPATTEAAPLSGLRVLDLTRILAGPTCGRMLAACGADVMLINSPHLPNIEAIIDTSRGKLSTLLDLRERAGAGLFTQLLSDAHVMVQGYRPGVLSNWASVRSRLLRFVRASCM